MSPSIAAPSIGIKTHTKKWHQQMALILLCEEDIDPTGSDVRCVRNDRICDIILQLYLSAQCQITPLTKNETGPHMEQLSSIWRAQALQIWYELSGPITLGSSQFFDLFFYVSTIRTGIKNTFWEKIVSTLTLLVAVGAQTFYCCI